MNDGTRAAGCNGLSEVGSSESDRRGPSVSAACGLRKDALPPEFVPCLQTYELLDNITISVIRKYRPAIRRGVKISCEACVSSAVKTRQQRKQRV